MNCKQLKKFAVAIVILTSMCCFRDVICCSKSDKKDSMKQVEYQKNTNSRIKSDPRLKLNDEFKVAGRKKTTKVLSGNLRS